MDQPLGRDEPFFLIMHEARNQGMEVLQYCRRAGRSPLGEFVRDQRFKDGDPRLRVIQVALETIATTSRESSFGREYLKYLKKWRVPGLHILEVRARGTAYRAFAFIGEHERLPEGTQAIVLLKFIKKEKDEDSDYLRHRPSVARLAREARPLFEGGARWITEGEYRRMIETMRSGADR